MFMIPTSIRSLFWHSRSSITELEASLAIYEPLVWISGALVLLGVLLEVVADRRNHKLGKYADRLKKIGEYLLICGLAGEICFGIATSVLSGLIIGKMHLATSEAKERTAKLQALLGPRSLTEEQKKTLADRLSKYSDIAVDVFILGQEDDTSMREALDFGRDLVGALGQLFDASGHSGLGCQPWPVVGVIVEAVQDESRDRYAAGEILTTLKSFEVGAIAYVPPIQLPPCSAFSTMPRTSSKPSHRTGWAKIVIIVGKRPAPILKIEEPQQPQR